MPTDGDEGRGVDVVPVAATPPADSQLQVELEAQLAAIRPRGRPLELITITPIGRDPRDLDSIACISGGTSAIANVILLSTDGIPQ